ncbi:MAG: TlpA family protein disulfide reductase [Deltaproteobacteria bacterium]|nr:TlpA family protein disulfide reductase [Deltaproteobacteria bacterium]
MNRPLPLALMAALVVFGASAPSRGADAIKVLGEPLSRLEFGIPEDAADKAYLGLDGAGLFRLPQIKADIIIIEVFSMYCPYCQAEAEHVNSLFVKIRDDQTFRSRVKLIGIGAGNTPFEVELFKKKFGVSFPMISDYRMTIQSAADQKFRTPTFIVAKPEGGARLKIIYTHVGKLGELDAFLKKALF